LTSLATDEHNTADFTALVKGLTGINELLDLGTFSAADEISALTLKDLDSECPYSQVPDVFANIPLVASKHHETSLHKAMEIRRARYEPMTTFKHQ